MTYHPILDASVAWRTPAEWLEECRRETVKPRAQSNLAPALTKAREREREREREKDRERERGHGCQMAIAGFIHCMCLALRASGLWLRYATLQNLIPSFPWIVPPRPPPWHDPRKGRDQILPSGNLERGYGRLSWVSSRQKSLWCNWVVALIRYWFEKRVGWGWLYAFAVSAHFCQNHP